MLARASLAWMPWLLCAGFMPGTGAGQDHLSPLLAAAAQADDGLASDMRSAHGFMLVVDDASGRLADSEAYGDWQWYLHSFTGKHRGDLPVHQVTPQRARALLPNWPADLRNATLFANAHGNGLLHRGMVLEPKVYQLGKEFAEHGSIRPEAASFGLEPFEWKPGRQCMLAEWLAVRRFVH